MRGKLEQPGLWESTKYVSWPHSHVHPIVRIPTPSGQPESKTVKRLPSEDERDIFNRCVAYRDNRGPEIWGVKRWSELVEVPRRSVAKHREQSAGPITGVYHYERPNGAMVWIASWYELSAEGTQSRRKRSVYFSYGTPYSRFATSEQAKAAAVERREKEEVRWYTTNGVGERRRANRLEDVCN